LIISTAVIGWGDSSVLLIEFTVVQCSGGNIAYEYNRYLYGL